MQLVGYRTESVQIVSCESYSILIMSFASLKEICLMSCCAWRAAGSLPRQEIFIYACGSSVQAQLRNQARVHTTILAGAALRRSRRIRAEDFTACQPQDDYGQAHTYMPCFVALIGGARSVGLFSLVIILDRGTLKLTTISLPRSSAVMWVTWVLQPRQTLRLLVCMHCSWRHEKSTSLDRYTVNCVAQLLKVRPGQGPVLIWEKPYAHAEPTMESAGKAERLSTRSDAIMLSCSPGSLEIVDLCGPAARRCELKGWSARPSQSAATLGNG